MSHCFPKQNIGVLSKIAVKTEKGFKFINRDSPSLEEKLNELGVGEIFNELKKYFLYTFSEINPSYFIMEIILAKGVIDEDIKFLLQYPYSLTKDINGKKAYLIYNTILDKGLEDIWDIDFP